MQNTYPTSETSGDGQVVVVSFTDGITFEVLPVFENKDGQSFTYPNSNNGGSWRVTNPRAEIAAIKKRNEVTNGNMKHLSRMMRIWREQCIVPISGWLIDTLVYQFIETYPYRDKSFVYHDWLVRDFLDFASQQNQQQAYWRAPGSGYNVPRAGIFEHKARSAYLRACEAIEFETNGHRWSATQKWRDIFGPLYPG